MNNKIARILVAGLLWLGSSHTNVFADEEADRETLRNMLSAVEQAINDRDIANVLEYFTATSVVVFPDKTVHTGPEDLQTYFDKMLGSSNSVLTDVKSSATISGPATFYGAETAVAHGTLADEYSFRGGANVQLDTVWTTTVAKIEDQWRIASLHISANIFDNPLMEKSKKLMLWAALGGLLAGLVIAWLLMRRKTRN